MLFRCWYLSWPAEMWSEAVAEALVLLTVCAGYPRPVVRGIALKWAEESRPQAPTRLSDICRTEVVRRALDRVDRISTQ
jgi:hypothetical protein